MKFGLGRWSEFLSVVKAYRGYSDGSSNVFVIKRYNVGAYLQELS